MSVPVLFIAVGETGSQIVRRICPKTTEKQKESLRIVALDTDDRGLRELEWDDPEVKCVYIPAEGEEKKTGPDGTISCPAFDDALVRGDLRLLDEALEELFRRRPEGRRPRIIIAGSLCERTGDMLILPAAMYTRDYLVNRIKNEDAAVTGFLMLPETFYSEVTDAVGRDAFTRRSDAGIREIDALMRRADGAPGGDAAPRFTVCPEDEARRREYTGRPFDTCILFDGHNMNGLSLRFREDYLDLAADCIHALTVMPEKTGRDVLGMDAMMREEMEKGRYAGVGASALVYPGKEIERYLAVCRLGEIISEDFLRIDREYRKERAGGAERPPRPGTEKNAADRGTYYLKAVNAAAGKNDPFALAIRGECMAAGDGEAVSAAALYLDSLKAYIAETAGALPEAYSEAEAELNVLLSEENALAGDGDEGAAAGEEEKTEGRKRPAKPKKKDRKAYIREAYRKLTEWEKASEELSRTAARAIVSAVREDTAPSGCRLGEQFRIGGKTVRPGAMRYFIYDAIRLLEGISAGKKRAVGGKRETVAAMRELLFDLDRTPDTIEDLEGFLADGRTGNTLFGKLSGDVKDTLERMRSLKDLTDELRTDAAAMTVWEETLAFFRDLAAAFEAFYDVADRTCAGVKGEAERTEKRFAPESGRAPVRYVCADGDCLRDLREEVLGLKLPEELPEEVNRGIFEGLRALALKRSGEGDPGETGKACAALFDRTVIKYIADGIDREYGEEIGMDVLTALEREAYYKCRFEEADPEEERKKIRFYMRDVIESMEYMATPFIERPLCRRTNVARMCICASGTLSSGDRERDGFVRTCLRDAEESADVSPDRILFFRRAWGIRPGDLRLFARAQDREE